MSWFRKQKRRIIFQNRQIEPIKKTRFNNPYFQKQVYRGPFSGRGKYYTIVLVLAGFYFCFWSGYFQVTSVVINGTQYLSEQNLKTIAEDFVASRRFLLFPQNNLLLTGRQVLADKILDSSQQEYALAALEVKKEYPSTIIINIEERVPSLTWITNNLIYYLDLNGKVTKRLEEGESIDENFPKLYDMTNNPVKMNEEAVNKEFVNFIFSIAQEFSLNFSQATIDSFRYDSDILPDLWLVTSGGWRIFLDTNQDPDGQIKNCQLVINEYFTDGQDELDYIDARLPDRIYYKTKF
ncbi:hypothetical protein KKI23_00445 [Patescibacteria group bacterium]|nr:hypothetical protein [Patescibacteria group bacterium]